MAEFEVGDHSEWVGVRAPQLTLNTLDGETISLADLKDKRVIIDVFRSWDPDCQEQIRSLNALFDEFDPEQVIIVGLTTDTQNDMNLLGDAAPKYKVARVDALPSPFNETKWYPATFFIDRNGVIDAVTIDNQTVEALRRLVTAADYADTSIDAPKPDMTGLKPGEPPLQFVQTWSVNIQNAQALCAGDWNNDGIAEALVVDKRPTLHVIDTHGKELDAINLPEGFKSVSYIEAGMHKEHGMRVLGLSQWRSAVFVSDSAGKQVWKYPGIQGINGAHWGDLDGDGNDEMIAGMNGFGGLHAVTPDGESLWTVRLIGNVWNQAVVGAIPESPARVFATEAGGRIYIFDSDGNKLRSVQPKGHYFTTLAAETIDATGRVQIIAIGDELRPATAEALAFDERGFVAWTTHIRTGPKAMRSQAFASGDIDGDGAREWLLQAADGSLVAASADGIRMGSIQVPNSVDYFSVLERNANSAVIVTLGSGKLTAYSVEAPTESSTTAATVESPA